MSLLQNALIQPLNYLKSLGSQLVYLLRDEFTTAQAAPLTSPRTCEPGPGTLTIVDTGNKLSIASGRLTFAARTGVFDPRAYGNNITRTIGLSIYVPMSNMTTDGGRVGFARDTIGNPSTQISVLSGREAVFCQNYTVDGVFMINPSSRTDACIAIRSAGSFYFLKSSGNWILWWIDRVTATASIYPAISTSANAAGADTSSYDFLRVFNLGASFTSDFGIATNYIASPAIGETTTSEADGWAEHTWTAVTATDWDFMIRRTDDNNCWIIRSSQSGSTIKLIEKNAGIETERSSAAQTYTNGIAYRVLVCYVGNIIRTYVQTGLTINFRNVYSSATFNNTATGVKSDRAGADMATWPRTLSGAALAELNRWTA